MRLTELDPRWYVLETGGPRVGFSFDCPHCRAARLAIAVHDAGHRILEADDSITHPPAPGKVWEITGGTDFHDLSLTPSVDASNSGHWHGVITLGEIR